MWPWSVPVCVTEEKFWNLTEWERSRIHHNLFYHAFYRTCPNFLTNCTLLARRFTDDTTGERERKKKKKRENVYITSHVIFVIIVVIGVLLNIRGRTVLINIIFLFIFFLSIMTFFILLSFLPSSLLSQNHSLPTLSPFLSVPLPLLLLLLLLLSRVLPFRHSSSQVNAQKDD